MTEDTKPKRKPFLKSHSAEEIRNLLHYDADSGAFFWKARPDSPGWTTRWADKCAGQATESQNRHNSFAHKRNTSGYKGVSWGKQNKKWQAHIMANNKRHFLGFFETKEEAFAAYCEAAKRLHGEFVRLGR